MSEDLTEGPQRTSGGVQQGPHHNLPVWKKTLYGIIVGVMALALLELVLLMVGVKTVLETADPSRGFSGLASVFTEDQEQGVFTSDPRQVPRNLGTFSSQQFLIDKPPEGLRLFCIGGSSAMGFPRGAAASFHAVLGELLESSLPARRVETINAAGMSYASHRLRFVADEILHYQPDILIIYSGHNEFVEKGVFRSLQQSVRQQAVLNPLLYRSRLYSLAYRALQPFTRSAGSENSWTVSPNAGLPTSVRRDPGERIPLAERTELVAFFAENLREIIRTCAGKQIKVVLCTVPANLRDWSPSRWESPALRPGGEWESWQDSIRRGRQALEELEPLLNPQNTSHPNRRTVAQQALAHFQSAAQRLPEDPQTVYWIARAQEGLQQWKAADASYRRACQLDDMAVRATDDVNRAIREVAASEEVIFVDIEKLFVDLSPQGLIGYNLIEDYVHPTVEGHQQIAYAIWKALCERELAPLLAGDQMESLFRQVCAARHDRILAEETTARFFYNQAVILNNQQQHEKAIAKFEQCLKLDPDYSAALYNLGLVLRQTGKVSRAQQAFRRAVSADPQMVEGHVQLAELLFAQQQTEDAITAYRQALAIRTSAARSQRILAARAHQGLGVALGSMGRWQESLGHFEHALQLNPQDPETHFNLGNALTLLGQLERAERHFRLAVRLRPQDLDSIFRLALVLHKQGRSQESRQLLEECLRLDGSFQPARTFLNKLGK
ncbi:MAG: hypothetical protein CMJ81_05500 [Planctomycetaceae bacterium]|nr:hypothetical protein [Planctomycetaceae bacterium]